MYNVHEPPQVAFIILLILAIVALIGFFIAIPVISSFAFWIAIAAYVVLARLAASCNAAPQWLSP